MNRFQRFSLSSAVFALAAFVVAPALIAAPQAAQKQPMQVAQASKADLATGTWTVDKAHTDVAFTVVHLGVSKVRGSFSDFDGTVVADGKKPENSSVSFTIKTDSISTANTARDNHLKSKDFFEVEKYPEITFKSTKVTRRKGGFNAVGTLTMHGVSKTVTLPFTVSGPQKGPDSKMHLGVDTAITLNRSDYGLTWNAVIEGTRAVSEEVNISISMELVK